MGGGVELINPAHNTVSVFGLVKSTYPSCTLPKWQVVKLTKFFATFRFFFEVVSKGEIY